MIMRAGRAASRAPSETGQGSGQLLGPGELAQRAAGDHLEHAEAADHAAGVPYHAPARRIPLGDLHRVGEADRAEPGPATTAAPVPCPPCTRVASIQSSCRAQSMASCHTRAGSAWTSTLAVISSAGAA